MKEFLKKKVEHWTQVFSKRLELEKAKTGFSDETAKIAAIIELMKEQVPNEDTRNTTS